MCHNPKDIQQAFEKYYRKLHSQPQAAEPTVIKSFLDFQDLPSVGVEQNKWVTQEITGAEINITTKNK